MKAIALFLSLLFVCEPLAVATARAQSPSQNSQPPTSAGNVAQSDKIKAFAVKLAEARTEDERAALLVNEKEIVTEELVRALLQQGQRVENQGNYDAALSTYDLAHRIAKQIGSNLMMAAALSSTGFVNYLQGDYAQAMQLYQQALELQERSGNKLGMASTLTNIGLVHAAQASYIPALEQYKRSLALSEPLGAKAEIALALDSIGEVYRLQGNYSQALDHLQKSLTLSEAADDKIMMGQTLGNIGIVYYRQGNYAQATEYYQRSLKLREQLGMKSGIARVLGNLGSVSAAQGNYASALDYFERSLKLHEELGARKEIARALTNVGSVYFRRGNFGPSLEHYQRGLKLREELGDKQGIAETLDRIGSVYYSQANYPQALNYYRRGLNVNEKIGNKRGIQLALNNIGVAYLEQGNHPQALEYLQKGLALSEALGTKSESAYALGNIALIHAKLGNQTQALEYAQRSLAAREALGDKLAIADALRNLGIAHGKLANYADSLKYSERAAVLAKQIGSREHLWSALSNAGIAYRGLGQFTQARQAFQEAIAVSESLRAAIVGQESRSTYFSSVQEPYKNYIDLLMELHKQHASEGYDAIALQTSERVRARSLLEALSEVGAEIRQGVDSTLLNEERTAQQKLNAAAERQTRLLIGKHTEDQAAVARLEVDDLTGKLQDAQAQIRLKSPRYAALTQPVPLGVQEIQQLLDKETLLLEYALGGERSYLWAVTPNSIKSFELPKGAEIETSVRGIVELLNHGHRWVTSNQINAEYANAAGQLSRTLLPAALMSQVKATRLVIVADGALQYLPFGALPGPKSNDQSPTSRNGQQARPPALSPRPLIVDYEIVSLPSASTIAVLRRETANRARPARSIAVLADPVFDGDDERVQIEKARSGQRTGPQTSATLRDASLAQTSDSRALLERALQLEKTGSNGGIREALRISRLPFTRFEAEGILAASAPGQSLKAIDFHASRETATGAELAQYRFVHFATHGILNSEHPELSGIVLSLVNEQGEPVDGFLRLHEIYNLNLPADLVVLSACQTGLGKEIRGEGLVGLTRGFMYAGAPRVVASLWKVDDAATAELMKRFYRGMLKENLRPAAALRAAKVEMWKQKGWQAPFYWAAFELQGEWK
jgi:CHAT domain-containing protein/Tfp pilus assembly protein PilF